MAGLIPQSFIDDLINRLDIVDVVSSRVQLKKTGKNYSACCPFHKEKTPSFTVSPDKQFYYCFGCGAGGNALGFVMDHDNLDFPQAVEELARAAGMEVPREQGRRDQKPRQPTDSPLYPLLDAASEFYRQALRSHPTRKAAVEYLKGRGLSGEVARDFGLGFAPPGWDNLLKHLGADTLQQKVMIDAGLLIENAETGKRYDRFRDRVMFPIRDSRGRIIAFGGRVLGDDKPKYLNSPETPVFHKGQELYGLYEARKHNRNLDEIIVVEGYMDVIALAQQGLRNAVATLGTATSEEHLKRLFRVVPSVLFCFDGDQAGRKAAWRALESALSRALSVPARRRRPGQPGPRRRHRRLHGPHQSARPTAGRLLLRAVEHRGRPSLARGQGAHGDPGCTVDRKNSGRQPASADAQPPAGHHRARSAAGRATGPAGPRGAQRRLRSRL